MGSPSNKRKNWVLLFMTAKPVILLIFLSCVTGLNGWKRDVFVTVPKDQSRNRGEIFPAKSASSIKPPIEIKMTPRQKHAENRYQPLILKAANRYGVEPEIIKAIIMAESGFNPKAVSNVGARGLMQLMPRTARSLGVEDSFKPAHNIDAGVRYFRQLLDEFDGEVKLALAAYHAGSFTVRKYGGIPPFKATAFYIHQVLKYYEAYRRI